MSRILVLFPTLLWLLWADVAGPEQDPRSPAVTPERITFFFGGMLLLVSTAALAALRSGRRRLAEGEASVEMLPLAYRLALPAMLGWFTIGLFVMGWGELAFSLTFVDAIPELRTLGIAVATLPAYGAWALLVGAEYPAVRRQREMRLLVDLDQGRPIYPPPALKTYWFATLRQRLLFALVPLLLLMLIRDAAVATLWLAGIPLTGHLDLWLFVLGALFVIAVSPELVRRLLPTRPLAAGPMRDRLEALCARTGLTMRDILVWDTDGSMVNAAVVGFLPRMRYVLLSDLMLDSMTPVQVEAVFAHEIGHVKHRHLLWYFVFLAGMTLFFAGPVEAGWRAFASAVPAMESLGAPLEYAIGLGSLAAILLLFALLSRCFERQADVFAARTMQAQAMDAAPTVIPMGTALARRRDLVGPAGAEVFGASLRHAARMNQLPVDRRPAQPGPLAPLWWLADQLSHFLHGTVNSRIEYLNSLARRPSQTRRFDLWIGAVKLGVLAVTVGSGSFLLW